MDKSQELKLITGFAIRRVLGPITFGVTFLSSLQATLSALHGFLCAETFLFFEV